MSAVKTFHRLEILRGICAIIVVLNHARGAMFIGGVEYLEVYKYSYDSILNILIMQPTRLGYQSVIFFFVMSGYSIANAISVNKSAINFYHRRVIRIYPPYLIGVFWGYLVYTSFELLSYNFNNIIGNVNFNSVNEVLLIFFYIPPPFLIPQYWSLIHEVLFYIFSPLIKLISHRLYFVISSLFYFIGFACSIDLSNDSLFIKYIFVCNFYFALGFILYFESNIIMLIPSFFAYFNHIKVLFAYVVVLILSSYANEFVAGLVASIVAFDIIRNINILNIPVPKLIANIIKYLGSVSYSLYITHFASIYLFILILEYFVGPLHGKFNNPYVWITSIPFIIFVNHLFYFSIEKPSRDYLHKKK